jgi:hypothetical protein
MKEYLRRDKGGPLRVRVLHGETPVWPAADWAVISVPDSPGCTHDLTLDVAKGETVRFVLDKGASPADDIIAWMPVITYKQKTDHYIGSTVRILCGSKKPYIDAAGNEWSADQFYKRGQAVSYPIEFADVTPTPSDQMLYRNGRSGKNFSYSISVEPGLYAVRLKLAEPKYEWIFQRPMNLSINGKQVLTNFDICQTAKRWKRACDQVFRYIVPDADGKIALQFTGGWEPLQKTDQALVQAIEVLPETKPTVRIDCGSESPFVDWSSFIWEADGHAEGGHSITSDAQVSQASPTTYDQGLYRTARAGKSFCYTVSVPSGLYTVHLKFAELWLKEVGQRPMNVEINGRRVRESWDPAQAAGQTGMAFDIRECYIPPDKNGHIVIRLSATGKNDAILQGIEIE